jgi:phosphoribosylanthranilate isomerase
MEDAMVLKICGITRAVDAETAVRHGATALGFVFWPKSPRYVTPDQAAAIVAGLPEGVASVGVFVNDTMDAIERIADHVALSMVQLHGDERAADAAALSRPIVRALTLDDSAACDEWPAETTFLIDAADRVRRGGTGQLVDWARAGELAARRRVILAGGLTADNVAEAVACVRPCGVDVSSGVEAAPGVKDSSKVAAFLANARRAFEQQACRR